MKVTIRNGNYAYISSDGILAETIQYGGGEVKVEVPDNATVLTDTVMDALSDARKAESLKGEDRPLYNKAIIARDKTLGMLSGGMEIELPLPTGLLSVKGKVETPVRNK